MSKVPTVPEPVDVPVTFVYVPKVLLASAAPKVSTVLCPPAGLTTMSNVAPPPPELATPVYVPGILFVGV